MGITVVVALTAANGFPKYLITDSNHPADRKSVV